MAGDYRRLAEEVAQGVLLDDSGFEHLEPQVFRVRFHTLEFRSGSTDMQAAVRSSLN